MTVANMIRVRLCALSFCELLWCNLRSMPCQINNRNFFLTQNGIIYLFAISLLLFQLGAGTDCTSLRESTSPASDGLLKVYDLETGQWTLPQKRCPVRREGHSARAFPRLLSAFLFLRERWLVFCGRGFVYFFFTMENPALRNCRPLPPSAQA